MQGSKKRASEVFKVWTKKKEKSLPKDQVDFFSKASPPQGNLRLHRPRLEPARVPTNLRVDLLFSVPPTLFIVGSSPATAALA
ncbi:hypothetical protein PoB_006287000 [Plakobranchus ocellatus]|uniref:Uncharacterized protein n=1 Tax=Plakobranchus ocellatus TaxID=259542 RepID=A0AAV4CX62_9GAST|nr:hypothetical protein PoB_006287000 [Plakobranchus ocellatus]